MSQNVLRAARGAGVKRFVHCSTEAVLVGGKKPIVNADETWPVPKVATTYPYRWLLCDLWNCCL